MWKEAGDLRLMGGRFEEVDAISYMVYTFTHALFMRFVTIRGVQTRESEFSLMNLSGNK